MKQAVQLALALASVTAAPAGRAQNDAGLSVTVLRAYRPMAAQTVVDVFCRVALPLADPVRGPGGSVLRFSVSVRDTSGVELVSRSGWMPRDPSAAEHLTFTAPPGRYTVQLTVTNSTSGRVSRETTSVDAFSHAPGASDLLLATAMREAADPSDTVARPGELRRGARFFVTAGEPVQAPQASRLTYYVEVYAAREQTVMVSSRVLTEAGTQVVATGPSPVSLHAGGGFADGVVDLGGLPPGRYRFEVLATGPDSQITRSARFDVTAGGLEAATGVAARAEMVEWPMGLAVTQLDEAYQPLIYLMSSDEQGVYSSLSVEGKRKWLRQFWARRDPSPGTARNEERERFYTAIAEADRRYGEGGASTIPGWRTDRGRIFIKYGAPADIRQRKAPAGTASPYEIWRYRGTPELKYVFMDLTRYGNFTLIYTNDLRERSRPDWQDLLGPEGLKDLDRD